MKTTFLVLACFAIVGSALSQVEPYVYRAVTSTGTEVPGANSGEFLELTDIDRYAISPDGSKIAFSGVAEDSLGNPLAGIWVDSGSGLELVLKSGDSAFGGAETWQAFTRIAINNAGTFVFEAGIANPFSRVIAVRAGGTITEIARQGEVAPPAADNRLFTGFRELWVNNLGTIAFAGSTQVPGGSVNGAWIYKDDVLTGIVFGELDEPLEFAFGDNDFMTFVQPAGLYTMEPQANGSGFQDKALRVPVGAEYAGSNPGFFGFFDGPLINASRDLAFIAIILDGADAPVGYALLKGSVPVGVGAITEFDALVDVPIADAQETYNLAIDPSGTLLTMVYALVNGDDFSFLNLLPGQPDTNPLVSTGDTIQTSAGNFLLKDLEASSASLTTDERVLFLNSFDNDTKQLILASRAVAPVPPPGPVPPPAPAPNPVVKPSKPVIEIKGSTKRKVRRPIITLRGTLSSEAGIARVETKAPGSKFRRANLQAGRTRWVAKKVRLPRKRNIIRIRATDLQGQKSVVRRVVVTRR